MKGTSQGSNHSTMALGAMVLGLVFLLFVAVGCVQPSGDPAASGDYSECSYTNGINDPDYADARVFHPCETGDGPFAATTLTGGFTNAYGQMNWLSKHLVTHGYIIIAMTPNVKLGPVPQWTQAHLAGIAMLKSENARAASPIRGLVNTNALQIMGYSKGGGGALQASAQLGAQIQSTAALAPWDYTGINFGVLDGIASNTLCITGTDDSIALPGKVVTMYNNLPDDINRTLAYFEGMGHLTWINSGGKANHDMAKTYITSWMKVHLDGDTSYNKYIDGSQSWIYEFAQNADAE